MKILKETNVMEKQIPQDKKSRVTERRFNTAKSFVYSFFKRRRKELRREDDNSKNIYVDLHETRIFVIFVTTILLSTIDAAFTLLIISNGGEEINPFMKYLLDNDVVLFFWIKFFLTSFGLLFLVSHKHFTVFQFINGYKIIYAVFATYFVLITYELSLLSKIFLTA